MSSEDYMSVLGDLSKIARKGYIPTISEGDTGVGLTLLDQLGVALTSSEKATYQGIVIKAIRTGRTNRQNRVNLFARVPNWKISACKSSAEILEKYGYSSSDGHGEKLFCTVRARVPNSQGLYLDIVDGNTVLSEKCRDGKDEVDVAKWLICDLKSRLDRSHPETIWVLARPFDKDGGEMFSYSEAIYTGPPDTEMLPTLLRSGTVTMDHLIQNKDGRVTEKGPLFKISPANIDALFPAPKKYDLLAMSP
ncbi:MAG: MvaI/BcnI family restriction endonuclease [Halieaceae bacterium]